MKKIISFLSLSIFSIHLFATISSSADGDINICPLQTDQVVFTIAEGTNAEFGGNTQDGVWPALAVLCTVNKTTSIYTT